MCVNTASLYVQYNEIELMCTYTKNVSSTGKDPHSTDLLYINSE